MNWIEGETQIVDRPLPSKLEGQKSLAISNRSRCDLQWFARAARDLSRAVRWLPWVWTFAAFMGCSSAAVPGAVEQRPQVTVRGGASAGQMPPSVDLSDKRIAVALTSVKSVLGHDVSFEIDDTLMPKFDRELHEAFVEALETLVTSLEYAQRYEKAALAFGGPYLKIIHWTYSPSRTSKPTQLDVERGRLDIPVPADAGRLLPDELVVSVLTRAWDDEKQRRYSKIRPAAVPLDEQGFYLQYVVRQRTKVENETSLQTELRRLHRINQVLELHPLIADEAVRDEASRFLVRSGRDLRSAFVELQEMPQLERDLRLVHEQWVRWLNEHFGTLRDTDQRELGSLFFARSYDRAPGFEAGLELPDLAKPALESWLSRREEASRRGFDTRDALNAMILCPYSHENHRFTAGLQSCNGLLYTGLSQQGRSYVPLLQLLAEHPLPELTQFATLNLLDNVGVEAAVGFVDRLWDDAGRAEAALTALAEFGHWGTRTNRRSELPALVPDTLLRRLPQWWAAHHEQRPTLLYLLVTLGDAYEGSVVWPRLTRYLGGPLSGDEVSGFLRKSPRTIWYLRNFVHAVGDGWSRSGTMIPELERFLNEAHTSGSSEPAPYYVTERCMEFVCIAGTTADVLALQRFLKDRAERYPSEARSLDSFVRSTPARLCPSAKAAAERDKRTVKPSVFFGD